MTSADWVIFWQEFDDEYEDIEGLIFRNNSGEWVAVFTVDCRDFRCQIDYNPWTGERLE